MDANSPPPTPLSSALESLNLLGWQVCREIERFQPDVVVGLLHSGWAPVAAAQAIWAETRTLPFPPAARSNIGKEKHKVYWADHPHRPPSFCCGECSGDEEIGHLLAWLDRRADWVETLRAQVLAAPGLEGLPQRILLVDDVKGGGGTSYTSLGLCELAFPEAEAHLAAGSADWTNDLTTAWLEEFVPELYETVREQLAEYTLSPSRRRYPASLYPLIKPLITGTQDTAPESLHWGTPDENSPAVRAVAAHLPAPDALDASGWAYAAIAGYCRSQAKSGPPPELDEKPAWELGIHTLQLDAGIRLMRQAWRPGGLSIRKIMQIGGFSRSKARAWLRKQASTSSLIPQGFGRSTIYVPSTVIPDWEPQPALEFYLVEDGRLAIGQYPRELYLDDLPGEENKISLDQALQNLLDQGFTAFIDLTQPGEWEYLDDYGPTLANLRTPAGRSPSSLRLPLERRRTPALSAIEQIVDRIQSLVSSGEQVYLHSAGLSSGRAVLATIAWLAQRGMPPQRALAHIEARSRSTRMMRWPRKPDTEAQHRWVLRIGVTESRGQRINGCHPIHHPFIR